MPTYTFDRTTKPGWVKVINSKGKCIKEVTVKEFDDTFTQIKGSEASK